MSCENCERLEKELSDLRGKLQETEAELRDVKDDLLDAELGREQKADEAEKLRQVVEDAADILKGAP